MYDKGWNIYWVLWWVLDSWWKFQQQRDGFNDWMIWIIIIWFWWEFWCIVWWNDCHQRLVWYFGFWWWFYHNHHRKRWYNLIGCIMGYFMLDANFFRNNQHHIYDLGNWNFCCLWLWNCNIWVNFCIFRKILILNHLRSLIWQFIKFWVNFVKEDFKFYWKNIKFIW